MLYLVGFSVIAVALTAVYLAKRAADGGAAPAWLRMLVRGNAAALAATLALATGFALLLQTAVNQGEASGIAFATAGALLPFLGLWLLARGQAAPEVTAEVSDLPPTTGGRPRRARPGVRPAVASDGAAAVQRAG